MLRLWKDGDFMRKRPVDYTGTIITAAMLAFFALVLLLERK
jgi:hypothetical protein